MREIPLTHGFVAIVDDEDFERLSAFRWYPIKGRRGAIYAGRTISPDEGLGVSTRQMQRDVLDPRGEVPGRIKADHIDGVTLDCRRANLRWADDHVSNINRCLFKNNTSGYRGVGLNRKAGRWYPRIRVHGRLINGRLYAAIEDAARAYNDLARKHFGEHAKLNEVPDNG